MTRTTVVMLGYALMVMLALIGCSGNGSSGASNKPVLTLKGAGR